jgi:hypothetical protein
MSKTTATAPETDGENQVGEVVGTVQLLAAGLPVPSTEPSAAVVEAAPGAETETAQETAQETAPEADRETGQEPGADGLTDRDREILAFERQWWKYAGAKEEAVRELFGMSATRYYQVLNALVDSPAALAHDPMLVRRLGRVRSTRQRARSARRLADGKA